MERKEFLKKAGLSLFGAQAIFLACKSSTDDVTVTNSASATITGFVCGSAVFSATATSGKTFTGTASVPYTGGNSASYSAGSAIASTGVTGLTATLAAGTLSTAGNLTYNIAGTPSAVGTASFALSFGGQTCTMALTINADGSTSSCTITSSETAGPFPTITPSSLVRSDITLDRTGVGFTIKIFIVNKNNSCAALSGALVDIWHCDKDGYYSEYGGTSMQTVDYTSVHFLRGRQTTDSNGLVTFKSIFPGWYQSRATHVHVHVYNSSGTSLLVTQIAFPEGSGSAVATVNAATSYGYTKGMTGYTYNASDSVFTDSVANELASVTGSLTDGYILTHTIIVSA